MPADSPLAGPGAVPRVEIYPSFNPLYHNYFLAGIARVFPARAIRFTTRGFPRLGHDCLAFRVRHEGTEKRYFIHANDSPDLDPDGLAWCDVFGKVNLARDLPYEEHQGKAVCLGPILSVQHWSDPGTVWQAVRNLVLANSRLISYRMANFDPRNQPDDISLLACYGRHLKNYSKTLTTQRRLPLEAYRPGTSRRDYVFFSSGLWPVATMSGEWAEANRMSNQSRVVFIDACRAQENVVFEGGFWARKRVPVPGFEAYTDPVDYPHPVYVEKTRESAVVFNTPSYKWCHSWKLAEFLAMGKAIVSLEPVRQLPAPLVHGVHIHYVDGSYDSMREAIDRICSDDAYRRTLEVNARRYFEDHLAPDVMIRRLLAAARAPAERPRAGAAAGRAAVG